MFKHHVIESIVARYNASYADAIEIANTLSEEIEDLRQQHQRAGETPDQSIRAIADLLAEYFGIWTTFDPKGDDDRPMAA